HPRLARDRSAQPLCGGRLWLFLLFEVSVVVAIAVYLVSFYIFVSIFSEGLAQDARWKILVVALVVAATLIVTSNSIKPPMLGLAAGCIAAAAVSFVGLIFLIRVTKQQALKITGSYLGFVLAYSVVISVLFGAFGAHAA